MNWVPMVLGQVTAVALLLSAGTFLVQSLASAIEQPDLAITHFSELDGISITNRSSEPIFVRRVESDLDERAVLLPPPPVLPPYNVGGLRIVRMPQSITIGETIQPGATLYRRLEPRVNYGAGNAKLAHLTAEAMQEIWRGRPYEILYFVTQDFQRENPYLLRAQVTMEFVWRGATVTSVQPIGAFLYRLESREPPPKAATP